jgi:hypothetical protein
MGDWYDFDEEPVVPFTDVTTLTGRQLSQALYDVDDERKYHSRYVRKHHGGVWTEEDDEMLASMNKWARMVFDEIMKRSRERETAKGEEGEKEKEDDEGAEEAKESEEPAENLNPKASEKEQSALGDKESLSSTSNQTPTR